MKIILIILLLMENIKRHAEEESEQSNQDVKRIKIEQNDENEKSIDLKNKEVEVINLIERNFNQEISERQNDIHLIQKRLLKSQKTLHLLRYAIIKSFYDRKELKVGINEELIINQNSISKNSQIDTQSRIHPAVKKILGKSPLQSEFLRTREQSQSSETTNTVIKVKQEPENDYNAANSELIVQDTTINHKSNIPIRNRSQSKHEIIIGNISKYSPSNSAQDSSTHKWMMYVRGPRNNPDISSIVKKVRFFLDPSYKPNDVIDIEQSPFHLSRRGWGEFPVRVQIHFKNNVNKSVNMIHNLKLDQTLSGRQILGNETAINIWLYDISAKPIKEEELNSENTLEIKKLTTDFKPKLVENNTKCDTKNNIFTIKPKNNSEVGHHFDHELISTIDHAYAAKQIVIDREKYKINKIPVKKFKTIREILYFLFKKMPLITSLAEDVNYKCCYPYVAKTLKEFSLWNIAKRTCAEWSRAKQIKRILEKFAITDHELWTTKFILMFGRTYAFTPRADYKIFEQKNESSHNISYDLKSDEFEVHSTLTEFIPIENLMENPQLKGTKFNEEEKSFVNVDDEENVNLKLEDYDNKSSETDSDLYLPCTYVKLCAEEVDVHLKDEEIEPNVFHNSSERVLLQAVKCLAEELIRTAWANKVIKQKGRNMNTAEIDRNDIFNVLLQRPEFELFTNEGLGKVLNISYSQLE